MSRLPLAGWWTTSFCGVALAGCTVLGTTDNAGPVVATAPPADARPIAAAIVEPDASASDVARHFAALQARRLEQGLLRTDPAPRDIPFTGRDIEDAFVWIALHDEYSFVGDRLVERASPAPLRRWEQPVRMRLEFGASVPTEMRRQDTRLVRDYATRLGRLTDHPVSLQAAGRTNFHVLVLDETERRAIGPRLRDLVPGIDGVTERVVTELPLGVSCLVLAFSRSGTDVYTDAIAVIRAELPDLSRHACYYEELAQGLGLPNDSPRLRPSLFNDTAEFAVLTRLDETLLRILYDTRLRPGMRAREARPIIREIAAELVGGES
ncbi:MAG: DUF2927 domain-containing protein [Rhodobacteraceae bacterium]|nr:DUF2927 domain-containing protein [Paracoccaceae bacterium]